MYTQLFFYDSIPMVSLRAAIALLDRERCNIRHLRVPLFFTLNEG
jgi:hypothetical protein